MVLVLSYRGPLGPPQGPRVIDIPDCGLARRLTFQRAVSSDY